MHPDVLPHLSCPICHAGLSPAARGAALACQAGHSFDRARQGYVDLAGGRVTHAGDTAEMVAARTTLLGAGHYRPLADAIIAATAGYRTGLAVDVGAGTGYYLAALLDARPDGVGLALDVAKPALRRASTAHPRLAAARADAWRRLPVADGAARLLLNVFAPRSGGEFHRVLHPDGALVVATPTPDHLRELVDAAELITVDPDKEERLGASLGPYFGQVGSERCEWRLRISPDEARALVTMGPSAWHATEERTAAGIAALGDPVRVTGSVRVSTWRPRPVQG